MIYSIMLECNDGSDPILEHIELTEEQRLSVLYRLHALKGRRSAFQVTPGM